MYIYKTQYPGHTEVHSKNIHLSIQHSKIIVNQCINTGRHTSSIVNFRVTFESSVKPKIMLRWIYILLYLRLNVKCTYKYNIMSHKIRCAIYISWKKKPRQATRWDVCLNFSRRMCLLYFDMMESGTSLGLPRYC